ncbi:carboxypeptidase-like regulatory domain-containing protein [Chryseobacterium fluminis]|uniref:carboxypeptidase-like regulatory domain-containing protein n=1 Tax=Chryseobacterium fluminis TaxID=2983606 RepID=UPI0022532495|nr:carboxypeptidase-like regulatory domain-containing protein [Chryseobacterium sp. MMS21-Ot14]UZT96598.1 carboxypeptidase-like regulatory domain-containing protein [Chryseobacterium sp. MMS21-Ot14]
MIKKLSLISLFTLLPASYYFAQTTVYAYVKDQDGKPVERAEVDLAESDDDKTADKIGYFQFVDLKPGHYLITVTKSSYESKILEFDVTNDEKRKDLGVITLNYSVGSDAGVVVIDDSANDTEDGGSAMQPTVGLLSSGRDAFQNVSAFELGAYWFRPRGVDNRFEDVVFNGVSMSKNDDGRIDFSNWGGLNDVTRYPYENVDNITPSEYTFGNLGGVVYYNTRASSYRKQTSLAYSFTNRSYLHRLMATYSSGLSKKGWAFTFSASRRWGDNAIIDGVYQDAYAYFGSIEKKFSDRHSINLTAFGSPTYRASNSPNTQEVYDIMGKDYNSYWGWQDGEKRNSRIRKVFEPMFMLTDYLKVGKNSNWTNTVSYQIGSDARSRLDWFHASDPNPTYYRKLPSYGLLTADEFRAQSQIDWDYLYNANRINLTNMDDSKRGASYTLVEDVNKDKTFNLASHFDTRLSDNWKLNINFNYQNLQSDNFRRVKDLLGANYAYNLNPFNNDAQYNIDDPNYQVKEGNRTQYSYQLTKNHYTLNISTEVDFAKWNFVASIFSSYSESYRNGDYRSGIAQFVNNSKGKSAVYDAIDAGIKGKITYKINGKNFIVYNGAFFSLAPTLNEIFINPRVVDYLTPGVKNQIINSNDLSYIMRGQILKLRLSGYYTTISNSTEISRYYAAASSTSTGSYNTLINEAMSGADKRYLGAELGFDVKITPTLNAVGVASIGEYKFTNTPQVYSFDDQNGFRSFGAANIKDYKVAGTPQKAFSLGLRYNSSRYWWVGASANYLMDQYLDFSALNKTAALYTVPGTTDMYYDGVTPELIQQLTAQKKFDDQFMLNANAGKSFQFGKYRMGISISVNNILNNRDYVTGGFEQGRLANFPDALEEYQRATPYFGPKLWYDRGRTFFTNVYLRF